MGVIFWGIYIIRCQGVKVAMLWGGLAVVAVRLVKIRARGKDQTKGTKETYIRV